MAYTPELTESASATLRRIAWSMGKPMSQTMNVIFMMAEDQRSLKSGFKIVQPDRTFEWLRNQRES